MSSMYYGAMPLGMAVFGPMADRFPMRGIMIGAGIAVICCGLVLKYRVIISSSIIYW